MRLGLLALIILVFLFPLFVVQASTLNVDYDYCSVTRLEAIYISCREEYLFSPYLWIDVFPGVNYVVIQRSLTIGGFRIQIILNNVSESKFYVRLPPLREYAGKTVIAWNLTVFYWYEYNGTGYIQEANYILKPESWSQAGWEWSFGDMYVIAIRLRPITTDQPAEAPSPPSPTDWLGWFNFLIYLLVQVARAIPPALSVLAVSISYLLQIAPFLLVIIPLHILAAFVYDPIVGVKTLSFYIELAKKIIDLLIRALHALIDLIGHLIPF